jgi:chromosome segregation ATPase
MSESRSPRSKPPERRRARRHPVTRLPSVRASILAGPDVEVVNVSPQGVLVASNVRLTPGAGICLNIWSNGQHHLLSGRIARVDTSIEGGLAKYNAGIALDNDFPAFDLPTPPTAETSPTGAHAAVEQTNVDGHAVPRDTRAELTTLRAALQEQRSHEQSLQRTVEMLKAALRSSERVRKTAEDEQTAARVAWSDERQRMQHDIESAVRRSVELDDHVAAFSEREARMIQERAAWLVERDALEERVRAAEAAAEAAEHQLTALGDREQRLVRALEDERGMLVVSLREKEQLLADVQALRAEAGRAAQVGEQLQQERRQRAADAERYAAQLEATEAWCADQQELIYQFREDMRRSHALLETWQSTRRSGSAAAEGSARELAADTHETHETHETDEELVREGSTIPDS